MQNKIVRKTLKTLFKQHGNMHITVDGEYCIGIVKKQSLIEIVLLDKNRSECEFLIPITILELIIRLSKFDGNTEVTSKGNNKYTLDVENFR